jgi:hypothetical protein
MHAGHAKLAAACTRAIYFVGMLEDDATVEIASLAPLAPRLVTTLRHHLADAAVAEPAAQALAMLFTKVATAEAAANDGAGGDDGGASKLRPALSKATREADMSTLLQ